MAIYLSIYLSIRLSVYFIYEIWFSILLEKFTTELSHFNTSWQFVDIKIVGELEVYYSFSQLLWHIFLQNILQTVSANVTMFAGTSEF